MSDNQIRPMLTCARTGHAANSDTVPVLRPCDCPPCITDRRIKQLEAENSELRKDAERLRKSCVALVQAMRNYEMNVDVSAPIEHCRMIDEARAAIDAARGNG